MSQNTGTYSPVLQYGQLTPQQSAKPTMYAPNPRGTPMQGYAQMSPAPPMSPSHAQMALYYTNPPVASPLPMAQSPYSIPTPRHTQIEDEDRETYLEFVRHKKMGMLPQNQSQQPRFSTPYHHQQYQQTYQPPPPNTMPPAPLPTFPARPPHQDSGYGSTDNYGAQAQPNLPQQQPYVHSTRPGHHYGNIIARGKSKVLMGDVKDNVRPNLHQQRQNHYTGAETFDESDVFAGDMTGADMRQFFQRPS